MKRNMFIGLAAVLCAALLWAGWPRSALLENGELPEERFRPSASVEIDDGGVPLAGPPELDAAGQSGEEDPFAAFPEEQLTVMNEVLELVNAARSNAGLAALELDPALCTAAQVRAGECVGTFSHTRPNGSKYATAIEEAGVVSSYTGENVATGHTSAKQVVAAWMSSEGHRANILNASFTRLGVGFAPNTGNRYRGYAWSQLFVR